MTRIYFCLLLLLACACTQEEAGSSLLRIRPTMQSRATALNFEAGDCIGLTITRSLGDYVNNEPLTYDGADFHSATLAWYAANDPAILRAYYPYRLEGLDTQFTIAANQQAGLTSSDLLAAYRAEVTPTAESVRMDFYHLLARLQIMLSNKSGEAIRSITIEGLSPTARIDWPTLTATADTSVARQAVIPYAITPETLYHAILVPQQASLTLRLTTDTQQYTKTIDAAMQSGKSYNLMVTLQQEALSLTLSGEIHDWAEGGNLGEEEDEAEDTPQQPAEEETLTIGNENYATCIVEGRRWMAENLRNAVEEVLVGSGYWYPSDGVHKVGEASLVATHGYLYNYDTAAALCPAGWHLPSAEELESLLTAPTGFFCCAGMYSTSGAYNLSSYLLGACSSEDTSRCHVLQFTNDGATTLKTLTQANGYSVRYVADK